jgi:hypothetical protein
MHTSVIICGIVVFISLGCTQAQEPHQTLSVDEAVRFVEAWDRAQLNKEMDHLDASMDAQYRYFSSRGHVRDRNWVLEMVGDSSYSLPEVQRSEITPIIHGPTAVVGTRWTATPYYKGIRYEDDQRCVLVLQKRAETIRLLSEHCTEIVD